MPRMRPNTVTDDYRYYRGERATMVTVPQSVHTRVSDYAHRNQMYIRQVVANAINFYIDFMEAKTRDEYAKVDDVRMKEEILKRMRASGVEVGTTGGEKKQEREEFTAVEMSKMVKLEKEQAVTQAQWEVTYEKLGGLTTATKKPLRKMAAAPLELIQLRQKYARVVLGVELDKEEARDVGGAMVTAAIAPEDSGVGAAGGAGGADGA